MAGRRHTRWRIGRRARVAGWSTLAAAAVLAVGAYVARGTATPMPPQPLFEPTAAAAAAPLPWHGRASKTVPGDILIADDDNSRLLLVTPQHRIVWRYPTPGHAVGRPFAHPDDAFFVPGTDLIVTNEEDEGTIAIVRFHNPQVVWEYGRFGVQGSAPGELDYPDDAFYYPKTGIVTVADIRNQRILFIDHKTHRIVRQYGKTGVQRVDPPTTFGAPNGDFPAPSGGMLVTQINGHDAVVLSRAGHLLSTVPFPGVTYPSDANYTPNGDIIVADYTTPGQVLIVSPTGKVVWRYAPTSGPGELRQPSLAVQLSNGNILLNDDANDRVIVINPHTRRIVWQYGHTGVAGSGPGYLDNPDGVDLLPAGSTP